MENLKALSEALEIDLPPAKETVPPTSSRWKIVSCVSIALLLVSLTGLALLWTSMDKNGWPSEEPQLTGVFFYDEEGNLLRTEAGWYLLEPGSRVTILVTFQDGRWTLDNHIAGVMGAALYLTPTGTGVYDLREQLAVQAIPDGNSAALFFWQIPDDLMGHLDVVPECTGGQTITETLNAAMKFE